MPRADTRRGEETLIYSHLPAQIKIANGFVLLQFHLMLVNVF